jgi:putative transposon-encoded protein
MLFERVKKVGKSGMFGMADMGSFFLLQRIEQLLSYERAVTPFNMGQDET